MSIYLLLLGSIVYGGLTGAFIKALKIALQNIKVRG